MITKLLPAKQDYFGDQLSGVFSYKTCRAYEDSLIAFRGAADVKEKMVDYEDVLNDDCIKAKEMVHFIMTIHGGSLREARLWQLMLMRQCYEAIDAFKTQSFSKDAPNPGASLRTAGRLGLCGDDIFFDDHKMSVSIATVSNNSKMLVHAGINIDDEGAPVKTFSLNKLDIFPNKFACTVLDKFAKEYTSVQKTLYKVLAVS